MENTDKGKRTQSTSIRLSNIDFLLSEFKRIIYEVYGFKISNRDVFGYCIRNANYLERVAISSTNIFEADKRLKAYPIRLEDYEQLKRLKTSSSLRGLSSRTLLSVMVMSNYAQLLSQRQLAIAPTTIKNKRQSTTTVPRSVDTRSHLDFLLGR